MGRSRLETTEQLICFYCENLPKQYVPSESLLSKMVYLADWKSAVNYGNQITDLNWKLEDETHEPIAQGIRLTELVKVCSTNQSGPCTARWTPLSTRSFLRQRRKTLVEASELSEQQKAIARSVLKLVDHKSSMDRLIEGTYPVSTQTLNEDMQLTAIANEYNERYKLHQKVLKQLDDRVAPTGQAS